MLSDELRVQIRHWFYAEHWKVGTIAQQLGVHPDTVRHALETEQFNRAKALRPLLTDPYVEFIRQTLQQYPRLCATLGQSFAKGLRQPAGCVHQGRSSTHQFRSRADHGQVDLRLCTAMPNRPQ